MTRRASELAVLLDSAPVGTVRAGREQACWFSYTDEYAAGRDRVPLSLTVPVRAGRHDIADWMDGLLPTLLDVREMWAERYGAESVEPMDMLATPIGWDCAGAVQFCPVERLDEMLARRPEVVPLGEDGLAQHLEAIRRGLPQMGVPHLWAPFSLAGAQAKTALHRAEGHWALPAGGAPSTHILKIALPEFPDNDLVEHVCMSALRRAGVPAARTEIVYAGAERAITVERYDRRTESGEFRRVHQEDLCQALGFPSRLKYQRHNGPAPADIAGFLRLFPGGAAGIARFFDALVCNWVLAASDAHAKNYSVLLSEHGPELAPLYDVCSMAPYVRQPQTAREIALAMRIGGAWTVGEASDPAAWRECAQELGLDPRRALERVEELAEAIPKSLSETLDDMPSSVTAAPAVDALAGLAEFSWKARGHRFGDTGAAASGPPASERSRTRCPYFGRRTRRRCIRPYRHPGPHRYQ